MTQRCYITREVEFRLFKPPTLPPALKSRLNSQLDLPIILRKWHVFSPWLERSQSSWLIGSMKLGAFKSMGRKTGTEGSAAMIKKTTFTPRREPLTSHEWEWDTFICIVYSSVWLYAKNCQNWYSMVEEEEEVMEEKSVCKPGTVISMSLPENAQACPRRSCSSSQPEPAHRQSWVIP